MPHNVLMHGPLEHVLDRAGIILHADRLGDLYMVVNLQSCMLFVGPREHAKLMCQTCLGEHSC